MRRKLCSIVLLVPLVVACSSSKRPTKTTLPSTTSSPSSSVTTTKTGRSGPSTTVPTFHIGGSTPTIAAPPAFACGLIGGSSSGPGKVFLTASQVAALLPTRPKQEYLGTSTFSSSHNPLLCKYTTNDGATYILAFDTSTATAASDFAQTVSSKVTLAERGCDGCRLGSLAQPDHLGTHEYTGRTLSRYQVVGVVDGAVYFEISSNSNEVSIPQLETMAQAITG